MAIRKGFFILVSQVCINQVPDKCDSLVADGLWFLSCCWLNLLKWWRLNQYKQLLGSNEVNISMVRNLTAGRTDCLLTGDVILKVSLINNIYHSYIFISCCFVLTYCKLYQQKIERHRHTDTYQMKRTIVTSIFLLNYDNFHKLINKGQRKFENELPFLRKVSILLFQ